MVEAETIITNQLCVVASLISGVPGSSVDDAGGGVISREHIGFLGLLYQRVATWPIRKIHR